MKIYVGNLSFSMSESELKAVFSEFGEVSDATLVTDRDTGRPRGFGFVEMRNDQEARSAIAALDGKEVGGRTIKVNEAKPKTSPSRRDQDGPAAPDCAAWRHGDARAARRAGRCAASAAAERGRILVVGAGRPLLSWR
jgi:RNA recognition motif-containing protein